MRRLLIACVLLSGCGSSPTAPTPPPIVAVTPVAVTPPVILPPTFPPADPRFDLTFYRQFAHDAFESPTRLQPLRRQAVAPRIYLRTVDDVGAPIDGVSLDQTAAALINTAGSLTGVFGLAGLDTGTETREGIAGWITVRWSPAANQPFCGEGEIGGSRITLYPKTANCRCPGGPLVRLRTVKHELGHVLGFYHTDNPNDLLYTPSGACDQEPSARERYHASLAYGRPIGSAAP